MANTFTLIESKTLSSNTSSITFSSVPQTYDDLVLIASAKSTGTRTATGVNIQFNSSSSNFSGIRIYGDGSSFGSYSSGNFAMAVVGTQTAANFTFSNSEIYIFNYTSSSAKPYSVCSVTENNGGDALADFTAGLWSDSTAISSITLITDTPGSEYLTSNSTFYLYGIKKS
jgi:hypothetical protein